MKKFKIVRSLYKTDYYESYKFQAQTLEGKNIFGADANVTRSRNMGSDWRGWVPSWGSCVRDSYESMIPEFKCIEKAMKLAEKLNK